MKRYILLFIVFKFFETPAFAKKMNILIQPFKNLGEKRYSWISRGISDTVINDLNKIKNIYVISDESRKRAIKEIELGQTGFLDEKTVIKAGALTSANLILSGSYQIIGKKLRIIVKLIKVSSGEVVKSVKLDGSPGKLFKMQDRIVFFLMKQLEKKQIKDIKPFQLDKTELTEIKRKYRAGLNAYQWYVKGMDTRNKKPKLALSYFENAIKLEPDYIDALIKAGYTSGRDLNLFSESFQYLKKAKNILEKKKMQQSSSYAYVLMNQGIIYATKGEINKSVKLFSRSKKLYYKLGLTQTSRYIALLANIGAYHLKIGKPHQAIDFLIDAHYKNIRANREISFLQFAIMRNLSVAHQTLGNSHYVLEYLEKAKYILQKLGLMNTGTHASLLINFGVYYYSRNKLDKSLGTYKKARLILEKLKLHKTKDYALALMNIAIIYSRRKKYSRAIEYYSKTLSIRKSLGLSNTADHSSLLMNMGVTYKAKRNFNKALGLYKQSKKLKESLGLTETAGYGHLILNIAVVHLNLEQKDKAGKYFRKAYNVYVKARFRGLEKREAKRLAERYGH